MATISKDIKLYKDDTLLTNLQEVPELGGSAESLEITTLADPAHVYTNGLLNYGDSLDFKFLYEQDQFMSLTNVEDTAASWKIELPDSLKCVFEGTHSVKLNGVGTNAVLTYTLSIKPTTKMGWQLGS